MGTILLLLCILTSVVQFCVMDRQYYEKHFRLQETARKLGSTQSDLVQSTDALLQYVAGKSEENNIKVKIKGEKQALLRSSEKEALLTIRSFDQKIRFVRNVSGLLAVAFFLFTWLSIQKLHDPWRLIAKGYIRGFIIFMFILAIGILLITIDQLTIGLTSNITAIFDSFEIFGSSKSIVGKILPDYFWTNMAWRMGVIFLIISGVILAACIAYLMYRSYRKKALLALKERS